MRGIGTKLSIKLYSKLNTGSLVYMDLFTELLNIVHFSFDQHMLAGATRSKFGKLITNKKSSITKKTIQFQPTTDKNLNPCQDQATEPPKSVANCKIDNRNNIPNSFPLSHVVH